MMQTFHVRAAVKSGHRLEIKDVPFPEGEEVDVLVLRHEAPATGATHPLRDTPVRYDQPTEPVADDEWDAAR